MIRLVFYTLFWFSQTAWCKDAALNVTHAELLRENGQHRLNADVEYRLTDTAHDALRNGVPLTFVLQLEIYPEPHAWWTLPIVNERRSFQVHYHSLAKLFQWKQDSADSPRGYASLGALLEDMGAIRRLPVDQTRVLTVGQRYQARLKFSLDIESLPLPLRPLAYLSPSWYLSSPWYSWPFVD